MRERDLAAHQVHPHLTHALEWPQHLFERCDFIGTVHASDAQGGLLIPLRIGIERDAFRRGFGMIVVAAAVILVFVVVLVAHGSSDVRVG